MTANARKVSSSKAYLTFFKSLFGAGLLSLPNVLAEVGLPLGISLYMLVALGCTATCYILLEARDVTEQYLLVSSSHRQQQQQQQEQEQDCTNDSGNDQQRLLERKPKQQQQHLVTYGDLASILLGPKMAFATRWIIIVLNFLFTAGLVIVMCENLIPILFHPPSPLLLLSDEEEKEEEEILLHHRTTLGYILFPIIAIILQIPWLQDMWIISALGLFVYTVGVMGSTIYSSFLSITSSPLLEQPRSTPTDIWQWKWNGIPSFIGSAVYAMEGINLALPTVHSMDDTTKSKQVVCNALMAYGLVTISFASVGYVGGLGGGEGTMRAEGECDVVTNCIFPKELQVVMQCALSLALLLSIPIMLYPSTEMLEVMLTDYYADHDKEKKQQLQSKIHLPYGSNNDVNAREQQYLKQSEISMSEFDNYGDAGSTNHAAKESPHSVITNNIDITGVDSTYQKSTHNHAVQQQINEEEPFISTKNDSNEPYSQEKSWKLRLVLAFLVTLLGCFTRSFTLFSSFVGAVGLTFAGFILPPWLYFKSMEKANLEINAYMWTLMVILVVFGLYNMTIGGISSFLDLVHGLL